MGYSQVRDYPGGIGEWISQGRRAEGYDLPTECPSQPSLAMASPVSEPDPTGRVRKRYRVSLILEDLPERSFGLLFTLWIGLVALGGAAMWCVQLMGLGAILKDGKPIPGGVGGLVEAIYFSFVSATSVGYGDMVPVGAASFVAVGEVILALLVFGLVVSKLVSHRQEVLVEEIHQLAWEERLRRVRTNLHMVLSDLQGVADSCGGEFKAEGSQLVRLESVMMVFSGELVSVRNLLYRPQREPDECMLQTLLINLTACLRELCDLLDRVPEATDRSSIVREARKAIADRAMEICGECVPVEYAPELHEWMDRIQNLGRKLSLRNGNQEEDSLESA